MNEFKLSPIYNLLTESKINFGAYPNIKYIVTNTKPGSSPHVLTLDDFNRLMDTGAVTKDILDLIHRRDFSENIPLNTGLGRVYNFYKNLKFQTTNAAISDKQKDMAIAGLKELQHIGDSLYQLNQQPTAVAPTVNLNQYPNLIKHCDIQDFNGGIVTITDAMILTFANNQDPEINKYYDAIIGKDKSLEATFNTPHETVYNLYKSLYTGCVNQNLQYKRLMSNFDKIDANQKPAGPIVDLKTLNLYSVAENSEIQLHYQLFGADGLPLYNQTFYHSFNFTILRRNFSFINKSNFNVHFTFARPVPGYLDTNGMYNIWFYNETLNNKPLKMKILHIKGSTLSNKTTSQFTICNAMEELINAISKLRN